MPDSVLNILYQLFCSGLPTIPCGPEYPSYFTDGDTNAPSQTAMNKKKLAAGCKTHVSMQWVASTLSKHHQKESDSGQPARTVHPELWKKPIPGGPSLSGSPERTGQEWNNRALVNFGRTRSQVGCHDTLPFIKGLDFLSTAAVGTFSYFQHGDGFKRTKKRTVNSDH